MFSLKSFLVAFVTVQSLLILIVASSLSINYKLANIDSAFESNKIKTKSDTQKLYKQNLEEISNKDLSYRHSPGELLVKLSSKPDDQFKSKINSIAKVDDFQIIPLANGGVYKLSSGQIKGANQNKAVESKVADPLKDLIRELSSDPMVEYVELNQNTAVPTFLPNDPNFPIQWSLDNTGAQVANSTAGVDIKAKQAWDITTGSSSVKIAIIDSGFDITHSELAANVDTANAYDFADNDNNVNSPAQYKTGPGFLLFHGSAVAGIAAGKGNEGVGSAGVCFQCKILPLKVFSDTKIVLNPTTGFYEYGAGASDNSMLISAINYAVSKGSKVINISLAYYAFSAILQSAIDSAKAQGVVIVAGAGNSNQESLTYPAAYNNVIAVASLLANNVKVASSNYGSWIDISVPTNFYTPELGETNGVTAPWYRLNNVNYSFFQSFGGTSAASPHIAGIVGLIMARNSRLNVQQITHILTNSLSVDDIYSANPSYAGKLGTGRANAYKALLHTPSSANVPDNKDDILFRNNVDGTNVLWRITDTGAYDRSYFLESADISWKIVGKGDFNNDGVSDIFWSNPVTGDTAIWQMYGDSTIKNAFVTANNPIAWKVAGIADFNNDNKSDVMWRNSSTGENKIWYFNSTSNSFSSVNITTVDLGWSVGAVGKFDSDGVADILWYHPTVGEVAFWAMNSNGTIKNPFSLPGLGANSGWFTAGVSDFDNDGRVDVLWRNSLYGYNGVWKFNATATTIIPINLPTLPDQNYQVAAFGRIDNDSIADIIWQNKANGEVGNWMFNVNGTLKSAVHLPNLGPNPSWEIKGNGKWL